MFLHALSWAGWTTFFVAALLGNARAGECRAVVTLVAGVAPASLHGRLEPYLRRFTLGIAKRVLAARFENLSRVAIAHAQFIIVI